MINKLNEKFEDFGSIPNPEVWEGIEAALDRQRKKRRLLWVFLPASVASIVIALLLVLQPSVPAKTKHIQAKGETPISKENRKDTGCCASKGDKIQQQRNNNTNKPSGPVMKRPEINPADQPLVLEETKDIENISPVLMLPDTLEDKLAADSLTTEKSLALKADSTAAADSSLTETPLIQPGAGIAQDTTGRKSHWSFSLQAGTWDAFNNRDELVSESSVSQSLDAGASSFVPPQTITILDTDTVSVLKPLSLRVHVAFTGKQGWTYTQGISFDRMHTFYNARETFFTSVGLNLGFGKSFTLSERFSLLPLFLLNYDRFVHEKTVAVPLTTAYVANPVKGQQLSLQLDVQLAFRLTKKQSLIFTPATKYYAFQSLSTVNGPVLRRDWWNGLHVGWKYTF